MDFCCIKGCALPPTFAVTPSLSYDARLYFCSDHMNVNALLAFKDGERNWDVEYVGHMSDCATYSEPAEPAGACDCGRAARLADHAG